MINLLIFSFCKEKKNDFTNTKPSISHVLQHLITMHTDIFPPNILHHGHIHLGELLAWEELMHALLEPSFGCLALQHPLLGLRVLAENLLVLRLLFLLLYPCLVLLILQVLLAYPRH